MEPSTLGTLLAALLGAAGCAPYPASDVPSLVTPPEIVEQMLRLAKVAPTDIVYDLGSGDGRLVIAAVQDFGARAAIGIEIDPFDFDMGDWEPQAMVRGDANGRAAPVYLWVVPER